MYVFSFYKGKEHRVYKTEGGYHLDKEFEAAGFDVHKNNMDMIVNDKSGRVTLRSDLLCTAPTSHMIDVSPKKFVYIVKKHRKAV